MTAPPDTAALVERWAALHGHADQSILDWCGDAIITLRTLQAENATLLAERGEVGDALLKAGFAWRIGSEAEYVRHALAAALERVEKAEREAEVNYIRAECDYAVRVDAEDRVARLTERVGELEAENGCLRGRINWLIDKASEPGLTDAERLSIIAYAPRVSARTALQPATDTPTAQVDVS